jgi:acetyltransferase-like isoleucine patch superfamily enzyme/acyl carrier protein
MAAPLSVREQSDRRRTHGKAEMSKTKDQAHLPLDESQFIRQRLFASDKSSFARYRELVFHSFSWPKLIRYELLTTFIGPIPGALGLLLRRYLYPALFRKVGKGAIFGTNLTLHHADRISLGDGVVLDCGVVVDARGAGDEGITIGNRVIVNRSAGLQAKVGHIAIGDDCNIGSNVDLVAQGPIILDARVSIACKATVAGGRYVVEKGSDDSEAKDRFTSGPIRIGSGARIGMGAIIQDGVKIGARAIVAPGAVVYEDVAEDMVVWGNPARPVRRRSTASAQAGKTASATTATAPTDGSKLQRDICEYLEKDLFIEFGAGGFSVSESLLDSNVMDSLALVRLLAWIEQSYAVDLDFASLDPSEIDSVEKIARRIDERKQ